MKLLALAICALCCMAFVVIIAADFLSKDEANKPVQPNKKP